MSQDNIPSKTRLHFGTERDALRILLTLVALGKVTVEETLSHFQDEPAAETKCGLDDCWRRLTEAAPIERPERIVSLRDVQLGRAHDEALDGLIRRAESCDRVTGYPATHGDLLSVLRELRDRRAADETF